MWLTLVLPHDSLVSVELFALGAHDAILLAADVAAIWSLDGHLGVSAELEDEWFWSGLGCIQTSITVY